MRIAYWDCFSGIAGNMNLRAMVGCGLSVDDLREDLAGALRNAADQTGR